MSRASVLVWLNGLCQDR